MGDPYKGKVAGHTLIAGGRTFAVYPYRRGLAPGVCSCGAESSPVGTVAERRAWHREHKADKLDDFLVRGEDERGRPVHL